MLLKDKVCIVTGAAAARGIGHAVAVLFAEQGARVVAVDQAMNDDVLRQLRSAVGAPGGREVDIVGIRCDVSQAQECEDVVRSVVDKWGGVDCLVHCAGILGRKSFLDVESEEYDLVMNVNLKGTFNICRSVLRAFLPRNAGVIVNLASAAAQRGGGLVGSSHYAASKGGVLSLTRAIAREFGPRGIRANAVCPAMIETSMLDEVTAPQRASILAAIPLQRTGSPRECAGVCLFLASELSAFVTGATIDVNGGSHIH
jgi:NAD(P)-dependent dehydrogenase (short-subunit alcohol dehydrogenase family)